MPLDKELYRWAYEQYRQWNEAELIDRALNAGKLSPQKAWSQYVDLFEFSHQMSLQQSRWQRNQKLADLDRYYTQIRKLEAWRQVRGRKT
jgi:hypothetical protein